MIEYKKRPKYGAPHRRYRPSEDVHGLGAVDAFYAQGGEDGEVATVRLKKRTGGAVITGRITTDPPWPRPTVWLDVETEWSIRRIRPEDVRSITVEGHLNDPPVYRGRN
jgi:hypothetical protein